MRKIEHIGIAVKDIKKANELYESLLGVPPYKNEEVPSEFVTTSFFRSGPNKIELVASTNLEGPIGRFIEKRGEGLHHIAFDVENIHDKMKELKLKGFQLLNDQPTRGADNKLVCFVHPKSANGVLIELCQEIKE